MEPKGLESRRLELPVHLNWEIEGIVCEFRVMVGISSWPGVALNGKPRVVREAAAAQTPAVTE
jgi:hypothetical protein